MGDALRDIRESAVRAAVHAACRTALARLAPALSRHAGAPAAVSAASLLLLEIGVGGVSLLRGQADREALRVRVSGAAASAASALAVAAVGAYAGPVVAGGFSLGLSLAASRREPPPARQQYEEALDAHLERFHGGLAADA